MSNVPRPINDCLLIEAETEFKHVQITEKKFDTRNKGMVKAVDNKDHEYLLDKLVYFMSYKDDAAIERDGKKLTFIKYNDVFGYDD